MSFWDSPKNRTFREIREATPDIYPTIEGLDDAFKKSVNLWFDTREVSDNDLFARFFQRILYRDFGQYMELLRIEPGIAHYDWLVQSYREAMETRDSDSTETATSEKSGTSTSTSTDARTENRTLTDALTLTTVTDESSSDDTTRTDNLTDRYGGADTTVHGHSVSTSDTSSSTAGGSDSTTDTTEGTTRSLEKIAPQSISYSSSQDSHDALDWAYPSGQREEGADTESTSQTTYGRTDSTTGSSTTTHSGTDTYNRGTSLSHTGTQSTTTDSERDATVTQTHGGTQTTATTHGGTLTDSGSTSEEAESTTAKSGSDIIKSRETGRSVDIATLLDNATAFIVKSSAFEWIRERLEPAFMGIY